MTTIEEKLKYIFEEVRGSKEYEFLFFEEIKNNFVISYMPCIGTKFHKDYLYLGAFGLPVDKKMLSENKLKEIIEKIK